MPDIYGRKNQPFGGAMSADSATLYFATGFNASTGKISWRTTEDVGLLAQQVGLNYQQPINRIYELASNKVFYVAGRCRGEGNIAAIVGPQSLSKSFLKNYGDVCQSSSNTMYIGYTPACDSFDSKTGFGRTDTNLGFDPKNPGKENVGQEIMALTGVVLTNVNFTVQAENMMFNQGVSFMFAALVI